MMLSILYEDSEIVCCLKPAGVLSTNGPDGMPQRLAAQLGGRPEQYRTVHRLDQVVRGVMLYARTPEAASRLGAQVMDHRFRKSYLAVIRGAPPEKNGVLRDYLARDRAERKTYVVPAPDRNARLAVLHYELLSQANGLSLVRVSPETGRTHQIRCQFASRDLPIAGDRKYSTVPADYPIALWSGYIRFQHPGTERTMEFAALPPAEAPWDCFSASLAELRNQIPPQPAPAP